MRQNEFFSNFRKKGQIGYWTIIFEVILIKGRLLRRGFTIAVLNMEGNMPERKDSLTICVTAGTTSSIRSKSREVGIGSS